MEEIEIGGPQSMQAVIFKSLKSPCESVARANRLQLGGLPHASSDMLPNVAGSLSLLVLPSQLSWVTSCPALHRWLTSKRPRRISCCGSLRSLWSLRGSHHGGLGAKIAKPQAQKGSLCCRYSRIRPYSQVMMYEDMIN